MWRRVAGAHLQAVHPLEQASSTEFAQITPISLVSSKNVSNVFQYFINLDMCLWFISSYIHESSWIIMNLWTCHSHPSVALQAWRQCPSYNPRHGTLIAECPHARPCPHRRSASGWRCERILQSAGDMAKTNHLITDIQNKVRGISWNFYEIVPISGLSRLVKCDDLLYTWSAFTIIFFDVWPKNAFSRGPTRNGVLFPKRQKMWFWCWLQPPGAFIPCLHLPSQFLPSSAPKKFLQYLSFFLMFLCFTLMWNQHHCLVL